MALCTAWPTTSPVRWRGTLGGRRRQARIAACAIESVSYGPNSFASARSATTRSKRENGGPKKGQSRRGGARGGVGRSHHRGDAIRLAPAGVSATLGTIHLIAAGWLERLAADAYHVLTVHLSHVFSAPSCLVFGFLWSFLQSAGDGVLQALNETIIHAKEPLERPSARDLIAGLTVFVSAVQIRRSTN